MENHTPTYDRSTFGHLNGYSVASMLVTIKCLQKELDGSDTEKVKVAQDVYEELLDGF